MKLSKHLRIFILPTLLFLFMSLASPLSVSAKPANKAPVISNPNPYVVTEVNVPESGTVNASDPERQSLTYEVSVNGLNGLAAITATGAWTYTPNLDYTGVDTFTVKVSDPLSKFALSIITITVNGPTPPPPPPADDLHYTALGDSIATGTLYLTTSIKPYVHYFAEHLEGLSTTQNVVLHDLPVDGYQTRDLYNGLGCNVEVSSNQPMIDAVVAADVITISVGGNNLMQAAYHESDGSYNFFNNLQFYKSDQGLKDFNDQWVPIIDKIKNLNHTAQIIVNTQYNPYDLLKNASLHTLVDTYLTGTKAVVIDNVTYNLQGLNDVINNNKSLGYKVADVFTGFDAYAKNMIYVDYLYAKTWNLLEYFSRNPHPRAAGQTIITNLVKAQYVP